MQLSRIFASKNEQRIAFLCALLLFSILAAFTLMKSARDALFLSHYSSRTLPYVMVLNTLVSSLAVALYIRLYRKFNLGRITRAALLAFAAGTLLLWKGFDIGIPRISGILYLWVGIYGTLAPVQGWAMAANEFSARQAKRAVGIVGGGAILGAIAGGLLAKFLSRAIEPQSLLPYASLFLLIAVAACLTLSSKEAEKIRVAAESAERQPIRKQFVMLLLLVVATGTIVSAFVDFQFKSVAQREFSNSRQLASFFGSFYAYMGAATLLLQVAGTSFLMRKLGVASTLSLLPLSMLICNSITPVVGIFTSSVLVRGSEELLRHSVDRSSLEVMYVALPERAKIRLKSLIDTIGVRVPEGIASLFLIAFFSIANLDLRVLFLLNTGLIGFWLICAVILGKRQYPRLLKEEMQRKEIDIDSVKANLFTMDFYRLLPELLRNGETETVLDLLELLYASRKRWLGRYLAVALEREEPEVRSRALRVLFHQDANLTGQVIRLVRDPDRATRREAVHYICLRSRVPKKLLAQLRKEDDLAIQVAATSSLLKKKALEPAVSEKLEELLRQAVEKEDVEARKEIAHLLEFAPPGKVVIDLYGELLSDPSMEVVRAALHSISYTHPVSLIPKLLRFMRYPALAQPVREALSGYGPRLLPHLSTILADPAGSVVRKKLALEVAADIGAAKALPMLVKAAGDSQLPVRFAAIKAMNRMNKYQSIRPPAGTIEGLIEKETMYLREELDRYRSINPREKSLLRNVLLQHIQWAFERLFRLLGLLFDQSGVYYAYLSWKSNEERQKDAALEFLEQTISPALRTALFPLLDSAQIQNADEPDPDSRRTAIVSVLQVNEPLLQAAAISELTNEELKSWQDQIKESVGTRMSHPLVQEIYERRTRLMADVMQNNEERPLSTIEKMETLAKIDIFSQLGSHELLLLADQAAEVKFQQGDVIFREGEIPRDAFSLVDGQIVLERGEKRLSTIHAGESFGTLELLSNQPRLFSATASRPSVCLKIDRELFWEILEDYPAVSRAILEVLVQQIRDLTDRIAPPVPDLSHAS